MRRSACNVDTIMEVKQPLQDEKEETPILGLGWQEDRITLGS